MKPQEHRHLSKMLEAIPLHLRGAEQSFDNEPSSDTSVKFLHPYVLRHESAISWMMSSFSVIDIRNDV